MTSFPVPKPSIQHHWPQQETEVSLADGAFKGLEKMKERQAKEAATPQQKEEKTQVDQAPYSKLSLVLFHPHSVCHFCGYLQYSSYSHSFTLSLAETVGKMKKFLDSIVQKSGKIRGLIREIDDNYSKSDLMTTPQPQRKPDVLVLLLVIAFLNRNWYISRIQPYTSFDWGKRRLCRISFRSWIPNMMLAMKCWPRVNWVDTRKSS